MPAEYKQITVVLILRRGSGWGTTHRPVDYSCTGTWTVQSMASTESGQGTRISPEDPYRSSNVVWSVPLRISLLGRQRACASHFPQLAWRGINVLMTRH